MSGQVAASNGDRIDPDAYLSVELGNSRSLIQVKRKKLDLLSEASTGNAQEERKSRRSRSRSSSPKRDKHGSVDQKKGHHHSHGSDSRSSKPLKWVTEGILIRVASKKAFSGKLYNCVLPVTTVLD